MTTPHDSKFIVFKRSDFNDMLTLAHGQLTVTGATKVLEEGAVDDAVVIRRQDVFAPPALDAYANAIMAAVEISLEVSGHVGGIDEDPEPVKRLREIADYFHAQAEEAYANSQRKVPD